VQSSKTAYYVAPAISQIIFTFDNDGDLPPAVTIENVGQGSSCAVVFLESDNGSTWSPIVSTTDTILPGGSVMKVVTSTRRKLALQAGGGVPITVKLDKQVNGSPSDLGSA
jgi:hypothetical protein